ncbi:MAG: enoyl-CoA hydratase-related protein, partial [Granulosicoccaceae bacterium]
MSKQIDFRVDPSAYRHWCVEYDGPIATLSMDVDENGGLFEGYELKLNSYDLGVDIELNDVVQRMRFEHPEIKVVVMRSGKENVFCAGANIRMLGGAAHSHKVNFCKFTNETRNAFEAAEQDSGQQYIAAVKGACAGGGYELALACNHIMLTDDSTSAVGLPEVPLLAVLPGTGGLTRITDKRKIRRDLADVFCSTEEGVKGQRAKDWRLVDELVPNSKFAEIVVERAKEFAAKSNKPDIKSGITFHPLERTATAEAVRWSTLDVEIDRAGRKATFILNGPEEDAPTDMNDFQAQGDQAYMLRLCRDLEDAILHMR